MTENLDEILADMPKEARMKVVADAAKRVADPPLAMMDEEYAERLNKLKAWFPEAREHFEETNDYDGLVGIMCVSDEVDQAISICVDNGSIKQGAGLAHRYGKTDLELTLRTRLMQDFFDEGKYSYAIHKADDVFDIIRWVERIRKRDSQFKEGVELDRYREQAADVYVVCVAHELPYSYYFQRNGEFRVDAPGSTSNLSGIGKISKLGRSSQLIKLLEELGKFGTLAEMAKDEKDWDNAWRWYEKMANFKGRVTHRFSKEDKLVRAANCAIKAEELVEAKRLYLLAEKYGEAGDIARKIGEEDEARNLYNQAIDAELNGKYSSPHLAARIAKKAGFDERVPELIDLAIEKDLQRDSYYSAATCCEEFGRIDQAIGFWLKDGNYHNAAKLEKKRGNNEQAKKYLALSRL